MKNRQKLLAFCLLYISLMQTLHPSSAHEAFQETESSSDFLRNTSNNSSPNNQQKPASPLAGSRLEPRSPKYESEMKDMEEELNNFEGLVLDKQKDVYRLFCRIEKLRARVKARDLPAEKARERMDKLLSAYDEVFEEQ